MNSQYKVSVVIPLLPEHRFSSDSLLSLANQSIRDFEVLLIDGGASLELERKILEQSLSLDLNIRWIRDHRQNISALRNHGIMESQSEYISFHNYPDCMSPFRIQKGIETLDQESDLVLVSSLVSSGDIRPGIKAEERSSRHPQSRLWSESEKMLESLMKRIESSGDKTSQRSYHIPDATTLMIRRKALLLAGLYDTRFSESPWATLDLSIRLYHHGSFKRLGVSLVQKVFKFHPFTPGIWSRSMEQMDLFYLLLVWRCGATPDRETRQILASFRAHWLRYWSGWFFRYRDGRKEGLKLALRAFSGNLLTVENWKWILKFFFPQSHYPRLFWFDRFIDSPRPSLFNMEGNGEILSSNWRLM